MAAEKHRHHDVILKQLLCIANDWKCNSRFHTHNTKCDDIHPDAEDAVGVFICKVCYNKMFNRAPTTWINVIELPKFLLTDFYTVVIRPLLQKPLGFALRGYVFLQNEKNVTLYDAINCGKLFSISPSNLYFNSIGTIPLEKTSMERVVGPISAMDIKTLFRGRHIKKQSSGFKTMYENRIPLLSHGILLLPGTQIRVRTSRVVRPSKGAKKTNGRLRVITRSMFHNIKMFTKEYNDKELCATHAFIMVQRRIMCNNPPLTLEIVLTAPDCVYSVSDIHPRDTIIHRKHHQHISIRNSETLTWDLLYSLLVNTHCSIITMKGSYEKAVRGGLLMPFSDIAVGGCFALLVDMAHHTLDTAHKPPPACTFVLKPLGPEHRPRSLHLSPSMKTETATYGTTSWSTSETDQVWSLVHQLWRYIPYPNENEYAKIE